MPAAVLAVSRDGGGGRGGEQRPLTEADGGQFQGVARVPCALPTHRLC